MELFVFIIALVLILVIAFVSNAISMSKRKKIFIVKLKNNFGKFERKAPLNDRDVNYKGFFFKSVKGEDFIIDEITWNDLEGETLYSSLNNCYSSTGQEVLYYKLRKPVLEPSDIKIKEFNDKVSVVTENEKERIDLQLLYATLGKTGKYSVFDYINLLGNVKKIPLFVFYIVWALYISVIAVAVCVPGCGYVAFGLIPLIIATAVFSFLQRSTIEQYITSFEYVVRTVNTADKFVKMNPKGFEKETEEIKRVRKELKGIKSSYLVFIKQSNRAGVTDILGAMLSLFNSLLLLDMFCFYKLLDTVRTRTDEFGELFELLGENEIVLSVANFRKAFPEHCTPVFIDENRIKGENLVHPLVATCVSNSFEIKKGMLITGSNASGKSTFLRTVLVNALLSETIYTATGKSFEMKPSVILSSMSLQDSLGDGESYYMTEIHSIKRILAARSTNYQIICFLDEVLRGTNTVERVAAATEILRNLSGDDILTFAATHDIELTHLLENEYENYHFTEEIKGEEGKEDIFFSYKLMEGRCNTRNALFLLKLMGYPDEVVSRASALSEGFITNGKWRNE